MELVLVRSGNVMTIYPAATSIAEMLAQLRTTAAPREIERRDDEPLADREGLGRVSFVLDTKFGRPFCPTCPTCPTCLTCAWR